jgi:hypothetical protein
MNVYGIVYTDDKKTWNEAVRQFADYEVFYLCEYVEAFEALRGDKAILFWYNDGSTKAVNVAFKRDVAGAKGLSGKIERGKYYDLQTPYGYGGMIIEGNNKAAAWEKYAEMCRDEKIVCEFVRFSLFSGSEAYYDGKVEKRTHNIVRNLEAPMDEIYYDFEHKVRKNLKKAERNNLELIIDENGEFFDDFLEIYYSTMDRNNAEEEYYFPREFFEKFRCMHDNAAWFHVKKDGKIISSELVIFNEKNCYSYLGGTYAEYFEFRPNELLKVGIMKWAKEKGIKNFVLGGGYGADDGIYKYKMSFAPKGVYDFCIGTKIMLPDIYEQLTELRSMDLEFDVNTKYFPKYRG